MTISLSRKAVLHGVCYGQLLILLMRNYANIDEHFLQFGVNVV
jgi:hypothetical protein